MTFKELAQSLGKELGVGIEVENDAFGIKVSSANGESAEVLVQGFDERGTVLMCADLGDVPPEGREELYRALLEANDLFSGTAGSTLSIDARTARVRLARYDTIGVLAEVGPAKALGAFTQTVAAWKQLVCDFRAAARPSADSGDLPMGAIQV